MNRCNARRSHLHHRVIPVEEHVVVAQLNHDVAYAVVHGIIENRLGDDILRGVDGIK
jgi:hypothetical protein